MKQKRTLVQRLAQSAFWRLMPDPFAAPMGNRAVEKERVMRILAFWGASEFDSFFTDAFLNRPDFQVEIVSGHRTSQRSPYAATVRRLRELHHRLQDGEFDIVISGSIWNTPRPGNKGLATSLAMAARYWTYKRGMLDAYWAPWVMPRKSRNKTPLAVLDRRDSTFVLPCDYPLLKASTLYFKKELFYWPQRSLGPLEVYLGKKRVLPHADKLRPLTYGISAKAIPESVKPMAERDIDIFMSGTTVPIRSASDIHTQPIVNPVRKMILERCKKLAGKYRVICHEGYLPQEQYDDYNRRARLIICTESFGCETLRIYDVAVSGAVPLITWPYAQNHMPLEPDRHAFYFSLIGDDFEKAIDRALSDPTRLEHMSRAAREFTIRHKENRRVADYVIEETQACRQGLQPVGASRNQPPDRDLSDTHRA